MSRRVVARPLRLWASVALCIVILTPTLTAGGLYAALTWWQQQTEQSHLAAARYVVEAAPLRWRDRRWQVATLRQLAALGVGAQLLDATGRPLLSTTIPLSPSQWSAAAGDGVKLTLPVSGSSSRPRGIAILFYVFPLPAYARVLVALAVGLLVLLLALAGVAWFLRQAVMRPLLAMSAAAQSMTEGHLDVHLPSSRIQELAAVATALGTMSAGLRAATQRQADMERERRLFIGAIAHDLRTPLFTLRAFLGGLKDGLATTPEKAARYVDVCQEKAGALDRLVADLFAYSRLEYLQQPPHLEPIELGTLLRRAAEGVQSQADEKEIAITLDGPSAPCPLTGDGHMLARAVQNLLDNAVRHTPNGGGIYVRWRRDAAAWIFAIEDTGPGIAAHDLPHLFAPLYRGESSRGRHSGGAGLGLAIARRIIEAHGGTLVAANRAAGGAAFTGTLPLAVVAPMTGERL